MAHPFHHAESSARRFGGTAADYQAVHDWFDETKAHYANWRHRALRHHSQGIFEAQERFGTTIRNSDGRDIPVRLIAEQHVKEDLGRIPSVQDWLSHIGRVDVPRWMTRGVDLSVVDPGEHPTPDSMPPKVE
ncbi:MAG: hypothetical protein WCK33_06520 [Phycisphaerae bacterium]